MLVGIPDFSVQPTSRSTSPENLFFHFKQGKVLMNTINPEPVLPVWAQVQPLLSQDTSPFELAHTGDQLILSPEPYSDPLITETDEVRYVDFNIFRSLDPQTASLLTACRHLWVWYETNRYCGKCASRLAPDQFERALRCPNCGNLLFPTIAPAVIVAITCGDRILLARNVRYQHYALIAGYVEVGETLEHALRREVLEEVGLEIHDVRYLGDQPWGVSGSHMFAFHAKADDHAPLQIQKSELADAKWFSREEIQPIPHKVSIAYELMERFRKGTL